MRFHRGSFGRAVSSYKPKTTSPLAGGNGYDAIGPDGSSDICRRIVITVPLNDIAIDMHGLPHDSVTIGDREIKSLSFKLTDVFSNTVSTNGHHISFSIIFLEDE